MPKHDLDFCNIRCARADAKAEEKYLKNQEDADKKYHEELQKNAKKICKFCHQLGHVVYQYGVLTCPKLKDNTCRRCGLLGHTDKFCTNF